MDIAYCPYCGVKITKRGQSSCSNCSESIIDIWKLLDSGFPTQSPRPTPPVTEPIVRLGPVVIVVLVLALMLAVGYFAFSQLLQMGPAVSGEGLILPPGGGTLENTPQAPAAQATLAILGLLAGLLAPPPGSGGEPGEQPYGEEQSLESSQMGWTLDMKAAADDPRPFQRTEERS